MIGILLVDDQQAVRRGLQLRLRLEPDLAVVGEVGTAREALAFAQALLPDVIVMDIGMQGTDGVDTIQRLRDAAPDSAVVVLTLHDDQDSRRWAREAGARAFVVKQGGAEGLLQAIRRAKEPCSQPGPDAEMGDRDAALISQNWTRGAGPVGDAPLNRRLQAGTKSGLVRLKCYSMKVWI